MTQYRLDSLNHAIIKLLQQDGRATNSEIARQLGVSETTIRKRIDRLIEQEVMSIAAVVHPRRVGFAVVGLIAIKVDFGHIPEVASQVAAMEEISYVGYSLGIHDLIAQVNCQSVDELNEFVTVKLPSIRGVKSTETTIVPRVVKSMHTWSPPESPRSSRRGAGRSIRKTDRTEVVSPQGVPTIGNGSRPN